MVAASEVISKYDKIYKTISYRVCISVKNIQISQSLENFIHKSGKRIRDKTCKRQFVIFFYHCFILPLPQNANFITKYFALSKVYTDKGGIK